MKHVWIVKYSCCPDTQAYSSKTKAMNSIEDVIKDYEPHDIHDYGSFVEVLSLKTAGCLVSIYCLMVN